LKTDINEIILYSTEDGKAEIEIILDKETQTIWLTQAQMAELFDVGVNTINHHISEIYQDEELKQNPTIRNYRIVRREGSREIEREITHYNLKVILSVGYRVRSKRGVQFRRWATEHLNEYLVKGFVMNDKRLKEPGGWDYFDELLEKIREIRASEKRFYQKIRDLFSQTSIDYDKASEEAQEFFAHVQNKLIFAETGKTATELIVERADGNKPNMGLTSWTGSKVRKKDIYTSKNYLTKDEVDELNKLVTMFLDFAEDRVKRRQEIKMQDWIVQANQFLSFHERKVLDGAGKVSKIAMEEHASKQYEVFEENRKKEALEAAEIEHVEELEKVLKKIEDKNDK